MPELDDSDLGRGRLAAPPPSEQPYEADVVVAAGEPVQDVPATTRAPAPWLQGIPGTTLRAFGAIGRDDQRPLHAADMRCRSQVPVMWLRRMDPPPPAEDVDG